MSVAMVEAAIQTGLPRSETFDAGELYGSGWNRNTIVNGERFNGNRAFLKPIADRANLTIMTNSPASHLVLDGTRVTGVAIQAANGNLDIVEAGEVIVCGGAFNSPQILMRSGIGPADHLRSVGVTPIVDLPVGENLVDHLLIGIVYTSKKPISDLNAYCTEGCCFAKSTPDLDHCDLQISFATTPHFAPEMNDGIPRYTIIPGITKPKSRGTVRLTHSSANNGLAIDPNYFADPADMKAMIAAVRLSREIGRQDALADWNGGEHWPGESVETDEQIADYVRKDVSTWFHPAGTCKMGIGEDAVVDPTLRVRGLDGLRVADASIMPDVVSVNTNAASMMIGWKAGGLLLAG
jgi:choline dehydrogenase